MIDYLSLRKKLNKAVRDAGIELSKNHTMELRMFDDFGNEQFVQIEVCLHHNKRLSAIQQKTVLHAYGVVIVSQHPGYIPGSIIDIISFLRFLKRVESSFPQLRSSEIKKLYRRNAHNTNEPYNNESPGDKSGLRGYGSAEDSTDHAPTSGNCKRHPNKEWIGPRTSNQSRHPFGMVKPEIPTVAPRGGNGTKMGGKGN